MSSKRRRKEFFVYTPGVAVPPDVTHVVVPPSVKILPEGAFRGCRRLREIVLPEGLQEIGADAFCGCRLLRRANLPSTLLKIRDSAFLDCTSLRSLDFPKGLAKIGTKSFCRSSLVRVRLPSTVIKIGASAFSGCLSLKEVTLANGIRKIGRWVFFKCTSLEYVLLPATLTEIGCEAFAHCQLLRMVNTCGGIQIIKEDAFVGCDLLDHIETPSKALAAVADEGGRHYDFPLVAIPDNNSWRTHNFLLVTNGAIPLTRASPLTRRPQVNRRQLIISSECFSSTCWIDMSEIQQAIVGILERESDWDDKHQGLRALLAPYELRHEKEVTTLLELGLWKARMAESDLSNPQIREDARLDCRAGVIIPNVLAFL